MLRRHRAAVALGVAAAVDALGFGDGADEEEEALAQASIHGKR